MQTDCQNSVLMNGIGTLQECFWEMTNSLKAICVHATTTAATLTNSSIATNTKAIGIKMKILENVEGEVK